MHIRLLCVFDTENKIKTPCANIPDKKNSLFFLLK